MRHLEPNIFRALGYPAWREDSKLGELFGNNFSASVAQCALVSRGGSEAFIFQQIYSILLLTLGEETRIVPMGHHRRRVVRLVLGAAHRAPELGATHDYHSTVSRLEYPVLTLAVVEIGGPRADGSTAEALRADAFLVLDGLSRRRGRWSGSELGELVGDRISSSVAQCALASCGGSEVVASSLIHLA